MNRNYCCPLGSFEHSIFIFRNEEDSNEYNVHSVEGKKRIEYQFGFCEAFNKKQIFSHDHSISLIEYYKFRIVVFVLTKKSV